MKIRKTHRDLEYSDSTMSSSSEAVRTITASTCKARRSAVGLITGSLVVPLALVSFGIHAQSLHEAVLIALAQYPAILAAQSKTEAADSDITRAQGAHWPQLAWTGTYNAYNSGNVPNAWIQSPTVSMNVWSGWKIQSDVERSQALATAGRQQQRITRDDVALLCTEGYLNWAHQIDMVRYARENLAVHQKIVTDIGKITQIDPGRRIDLNQAQVRYENAKLSLEQREAELTSAAQRLNRMLLGQMPPAPSGIDFEPGVSPASPELALAEINDTHPVIAQQRAQVDAAEASVRNARSQYSPQVNVTYGKQTYQGTAQGDYLAQLVVTVPIFQGGSAYGAVGTATANLQAVEFNLQEVRLILREKIMAFWADWLSAKNRSQLGVSQVKTAQTLVDGYWMQFQVGRRSLLDLLNVQSDLYTYQSNWSTAVFESSVARARLMATTGKLANSYGATTVSAGQDGTVQKYRVSSVSTVAASDDSGSQWMAPSVGTLPVSLANNLTLE